MTKIKPEIKYNMERLFWIVMGMGLILSGVFGKEPLLYVMGIFVCGLIIGSSN